MQQHDHRPTFREFIKDIESLEGDDTRVRFVCKHCGESGYLDDETIQRAKVTCRKRKRRQLYWHTFRLFHIIAILIPFSLAQWFGNWYPLLLLAAYLLYLAFIHKPYFELRRICKTANFQKRNI